jgi:hypothetical protein
VVRLVAVALVAATLAGCGSAQRSRAPGPSPPVRTNAPVHPTASRPVLRRPAVGVTAIRRTTTSTTEALAGVLRLGEGGLGRARFGDDPDRVVAYVGAALGRPDEDSGWGHDTGYGACPGSSSRVVRWGWLLVFFGEETPMASGRRQFAGWRYGPLVNELALSPAGLRTSTAVAIGTTTARLRALFPAALRVGVGRPAPFVVGTSFRGLLDRPGGAVVQLEAGATCD